MTHISRKTAEVADLPFGYLQLFAADPEHPDLIDDETEADEVDESEDLNDEDLEQPDQPEDMRGKQDPPPDDKAKPEDTPEKIKQDKATNDAFQKMRQEKEAAEKRASDLEAKRQRDLEVARKYGADYGVYSDEDVARLYGDRGLKTVEQFEVQLQKEAYEKAGIPPEMIEKMSKVDQLIKEQETRKQQEQKERQDRALVENFTELNKTYPDLVKSAADVPEAVWKKWNNGDSGFTLTEVFRAVNHDAILFRTKAATKQATLNSINSKKHLGTEADGAGDVADDIVIDPQTMEMYKGMGMSKAQASKHHKKLYG